MPGLIEAMRLRQAADEAYGRQDCQSASSLYQQAVVSAQRHLPSTGIDARAFIASCMAPLAACLNNLRDPAAGLRCAEEALAFYRQPHVAALYPTETGRWHTALVGRAACLAGLGRLEEALAAMQEARAMVGDAPADAARRAECDQYILALEAETRRRKPWWRLW